MLLYNYAVIYCIVPQSQLRFFDQIQNIWQENWLRSSALSIHDQAYCAQFVFRPVLVLALLLVEILYLSERSAVIQLKVVFAFLYLQLYVVEIYLLFDKRERFRLIKQFNNTFRVDR